MNPYTVRFPNGAVHSTPTLAAALRYAARATRTTYPGGRGAPGMPSVYKGAAKLPFHIPVAVGLLDSRGRDMPLKLDGAGKAAGTTVVLELRESKQTFRFLDVAEKPVPSILRDFSAPVILDVDYSDADLAFLMAKDSDAFNRWEAGQRLASRKLCAAAVAISAGGSAPQEADPALVTAFRATLADKALDPAFKELALTLPSEGMLAEEMPVIDPHAIHRARNALRLALARALRPEWEAAYRENQTPGAYSPDAASAASWSALVTAVIASA